MKRIATYFLSFVAAAGILSATSVQTVNADLTGVGTKLMDSQSYYVGPYTLNVNGTSYAALCVDFQDNATIGTHYTAYETQLGSGDLSHTYHPTETVQYKEEAYLLNLILQPNADRIDIQHAAWSITDPNYKANNSAEAFVNLAEANYQTLNFNNFDIISGAFTGSGRAQEFMIEVPGAPAAAAPEPSTVLLMGGGLLVAVGLARRKMSKKVSA
jgi:hypothetical protein